MGAYNGDRRSIPFICKGVLMRKLLRLFQRFSTLFKKSAYERDLDEEMQSNLHLEIEDKIRSGMAPAEARRIALQKFGSIEAAKEGVRDLRGIPFVETLARDVAYAVRMLRKNKGWSLVAILSLALGIGANSALFSIVNDYALAKLPVQDPDRLVVFRWFGKNTVKSLQSEQSGIAQSSNEPAGAAFSDYALERFQQANHTLSDVFAFASTDELNILAVGQSEFASGRFVTGNFYSALGVAASAGRLLTAADDSESAGPAAVISHQYWERRF